MINNYVARAKLGYRKRAACSFRFRERKLTDIARELERSGNENQARRARRLINARKRLDEVRAEAVKLSPALRGKIDWRHIQEEALKERSRSDIVYDDVRSALIVAVCRDIQDWPEEEARALLKDYMKGSRSNRVRVSMAWALCGGRLGAIGTDVLYTLLEDEDQRVRVAAAYALLDRNDGRGVDQVFSALLVENSDVAELAQTTFRKKILSSDPAHRLAGKIDGRPFAPAVVLNDKAVKALGELWYKIAGKPEHWYLRRATLYLLGLSGSQEAIPPLRHALTTEVQRNLQRAIAGLGLLRCREAVPDILKYLERGRSPLWGTTRWNGDKAEEHASTALVRIGDPESVAPIIALLDSKKDVVAPLARKTLNRMFAPDLAPDRCLLPKGAALTRVRVDDVPEPAALKAAWQTFWEQQGDRYAWNPDDAVLK